MIPVDVLAGEMHVSPSIDNDNHLDGVANGEVRRPGARLLGNTLAGELGANAPVAPDNSALLYRGGCP